MLDDLLDDINDTSVRAIVGVFNFIFVRVPRFLWETTVAYFPILAKTILAIFLLLVIILTIFGPSFTITIPLLNPQLHEHPFVHRLNSLQGDSIVPNIVIVCWTILALSGAIWGTAHLKRKLRPTRPPMGLTSGVILVATAMGVSYLLALSPRIFLKSHYSPTMQTGDANSLITVDSNESTQTESAGSEEAGQLLHTFTSADGARKITAKIIQVDASRREVVLQIAGQQETKRSKFESFTDSDIKFLEEHDDGIATTSN